MLNVECGKSAYRSGGFNTKIHKGVTQRCTKEEPVLFVLLCTAFSLVFFVLKPPLKSSYFGTSQYFGTSAPLNIGMPYKGPDSYRVTQR